MAETNSTRNAKPVASEAERLATAALAGAQASIEDLVAGSRLDGAAPMPIPELDAGSAAAPGSLALLGDVDLHVSVELGRTQMLVEDVLRLGEGAVVELDKLAGDPVDVYVNERLVARGEVLVLNDSFCIRISEIVTDPDDGTLQMD